MDLSASAKAILAISRCIGALPNSSTRYCPEAILPHHAARKGKAQQKKGPAKTAPKNSER
jgi:hypothetical protein